MHLLPATTVSLDETDRAVDLGLPPGDVVALSFADSDLTALAAAAKDFGRSVRLASLRRLRHPLSVDLFVEKTLPGARFVLARCLGGPDYWRYGLERLRAACAAANIPLVALAGDDQSHARLTDYSRAPADIIASCASYFEAGGGVANMRGLLAAIADFLDGRPHQERPLLCAPCFAYQADVGQIDWRDWIARLGPNQPFALTLAYRSAVNAGDVAAVDALAHALAERRVGTILLAITSLKDPDVADELRRVIAARKPDIIITTTAFAARDGEGFVLDRADCPVLQAIPVGSEREAWTASRRGLSAVDLAMQIALPEFDGRIGCIPIAFKTDFHDQDTGLAWRGFAPDTIGVAALADLALGWIDLARKPRAERRLALVMSDYPARGGRAGFAVGLDTPASAVAIHGLLRDEGYDVASAPDASDLMRRLCDGPADFAAPLAAYQAWLATIPAAARDALIAAHGEPQDDEACIDGAFRFRTVRCGRLLIALQPPRDAGLDRKARYHDADAPPGHAYLAFYAALRAIERVDALIHLGTHGTTEWLPGKAVALSGGCWPQIITRGLPVIYPYVVDDPGEAAPAKRRLGAVTIGHAPPPLRGDEIGGDAALLRDLVEEYSAAQTLDPRRADLIAMEIRTRADASGMALACGVDAQTSMSDALTALDAHLCDLAESPYRDGLHIFGDGAADDVSSANERRNFIAALDGRFIPPGPSGSPHRGRVDVLPTGRNLTTLDPRAIPTRSATTLGARAAEAVVTRHLQDHGDWPRRIVMDLWASPTLRSGGEDIAHALRLMGVDPIWDSSSTRVTGFSIRPQAKLAHPRIDVTLRVSGAFRDTFPTQIALLDSAARAVAALNEDDAWNELAAARRRGDGLSRVFGAAPGRFGAGVADLALDRDWRQRADLARAYLAATDHAYGGVEGDARVDSDFAARLARADAFVHVSDTPGRDILEATSAPDAIGGALAAAQALGGHPVAYSLDVSRPDAPKARTLAEDLSRIVHGRLCRPAWIDGQLRHGWRGAAELAEAVDAFFVYAATTDAASSALFDALFNAYCVDERVWAALQSANPAAAEAIRARLADARERGFWVTRSNSVTARLGRREAAE